MEFNVGDRVLVGELSNYHTEDGHTIPVNRDMLRFIGKQYIIDSVREFYGEKLYWIGSRWGTHWWFVSDWLMPVQGRVDMYE
jgi:hypothetical protein